MRVKLYSVIAVFMVLSMIPVYGADDGLMDAAIILTRMKQSKRQIPIEAPSPDAKRVNYTQHTVHVTAEITVTYQGTFESRKAPRVKGKQWKLSEQKLLFALSGWGLGHHEIADIMTRGYQGVRQRFYKLRKKMAPEPIDDSSKRVKWEKLRIEALKKHLEDRTPVSDIVKAMGINISAVRWKLVELINSEI